VKGRSLWSVGLVFRHWDALILVFEPILVTSFPKEAKGVLQNGPLHNVTLFHWGEQVQN